MSKKRSKRSRRFVSSHSSRATNRHHLCWERRRWNYGSLKALRSHPYCNIEIPALTLHRTIHEQMRQIPPPSLESAKDALWHLWYLEKMGGISLDDNIEKRLSVLIALFDYTDQPTADGFKKQLQIVREFYKKPP